MSRKIVLSFVIFLLSVQSAFAASLIINPSMDTYVMNAMELDHSIENTLDVDNYVTSKVSLVQFDIASYLPADTIINSATLAFEIQGFRIGANGRFPGATFHSINKPWLDSTVVWSDIYLSPVGYPQQDPGNNFYDSTAIYTYNPIFPIGWVAFDATLPARDWLTNINNGILIAPFWSDEWTGGLSFYSSESSGESYVYNDDPTHHPKLIIDYTEGQSGNEVPEPLTVFMFGFGIIGLFLKKKFS